MLEHQERRPIIKQGSFCQALRTHIDVHDFSQHQSMVASGIHAGEAALDAGERLGKEWCTGLPNLQGNIPEGFALQIFTREPERASWFWASTSTAKMPLWRIIGKAYDVKLRLTRTRGGVSDIEQKA